MQSTTVDGITTGRKAGSSTWMQILEKSWKKARPKELSAGAEIVVNGIVYIVERYVGGGLTGQVYQASHLTPMVQL